MSNNNDLEIFDEIKEDLEDAIEFHEGDRKVMNEIEVYFVFKYDDNNDTLYLQRDRSMLSERIREFSKSNDIQILSEHEAVDLASQYDAVVGSTIVKVQL